VGDQGSAATRFDDAAEKPMDVRIFSMTRMVGTSLTSDGKRGDGVILDLIAVPGWHVPTFGNSPRPHRAQAGPSG
jgi:hypothetical protein